MKSIVRKTKDNSGVTIIMALLFMLVCVLVSTVLLATAGTAARDVRRQKEQQQAYLAVSSAVELIKNDICNCKYLEDSESPTVSAVSSETEMAFSNLLNEALQSDRSESSFGPKTFVMTVEDKPDLDVSVQFSMDKNNAITVTCKSKNTEPGTGYQMTARFRSDSYSGDSRYDTWELSSISKG